MARTGAEIWSRGLALRAGTWHWDYEAVSGTVCCNLELGLRFGSKFVWVFLSFVTGGWSRGLGFGTKGWQWWLRFGTGSWYWGLVMGESKGRYTRCINSSIKGQIHNLLVQFLADRKFYSCLGAFQMVPGDINWWDLLNLTMHKSNGSCVQEFGAEMRVNLGVLDATFLWLRCILPSLAPQS